jgi:type IV pilus assembly protein PilE
MRNSIHPARKAQRGFTLIELMIAVVVATILLAIAIPSYNVQVRKSRRTEAKSALLDIASREERLFTTTNTYSNVAANLGFTGVFPQTVGSGYYSVAIAVVAAAPPQPATFTVTATPVGTQVADIQCASFTVNQLGRQSALNSVGVDATATCWN